MAKIDPDLQWMLNAIEVDAELFRQLDALDEAAEGQLIEIAAGQRPDVPAAQRCRAVFLLGVHRPAAASEVLATLTVQEADEAIRLTAIYGLARADPERARAHLPQVLVTQHASLAERAHALTLLAEIGDAETASTVAAWRTDNEDPLLDLLAEDLLTRLERPI